jgi:hypothetical protein
MRSAGAAARLSELLHLTLSDSKRPACMLNRFLGQAARLQRLPFLAGSIATAPRVAAARAAREFDSVDSKLVTPPASSASRRTVPILDRAVGRPPTTNALFAGRGEL